MPVICEGSEYASLKYQICFLCQCEKRYFVVIHAKFNYTDYSGVKVHLATLSPDCMCYTPKRQTMIGFNGSQSGSAGFGRSRTHLP